MISRLLLLELLLLLASDSILVLGFSAVQLELPRLPRIYWGEIIYATPGSGKTYVASKYKDVWDADDLIVYTIYEETDFDCSYRKWGETDRRVIIGAFFRSIKFDKVTSEHIYRLALRKMRDKCSDGDVVLLGTKDLMHEADRVFIQKDEDIVRDGFKRDKEIMMMVEYLPYFIAAGTYVHLINEYLDNSLQKRIRGN